MRPTKSVVRAGNHQQRPAPPVAQIPLAIRARFTTDQANTAASPPGSERTLVGQQRRESGADGDDDEHHSKRPHLHIGPAADHQDRGREERNEQDRPHPDAQCVRCRGRTRSIGGLGLAHLRHSLTARQPPSSRRLGAPEQLECESGASARPFELRYVSPLEVNPSIGHSGYGGTHVG